MPYASGVNLGRDVPLDLSCTQTIDRSALHPGKNTRILRLVTSSMPTAAVLLGASTHTSARTVGLAEYGEEPFL